MGELILALVLFGIPAVMYAYAFWMLGRSNDR